MKKWPMLLFTLFASVFLVVGCSGESTSNQVNDAETDEIEEVVVSVSKDEEAEVLSEKVIAIEEGDILLDVMKDNFVIEETDGFINSIDDVAPAEGEEKAWIFFVNGELANVGAAEYKLAAGDYVVFDLQAWE